MGEDGKRYSRSSPAATASGLSDDGLSTVGEVEHVYDPWKYRDDWVVEGFAPEGPKILRRGRVVLSHHRSRRHGRPAHRPHGDRGALEVHQRAVAGCAQQSHRPHLVCTREMVVARACDIGRRTGEGAAGSSGSWSIGYENGYRTLGRQTLLDPVEWTKDGWFEARGGDLSKPLEKPVSIAGAPHGTALSDDFSADRIGLQWSFLLAGANENARRNWSPGLLRLAASRQDADRLPPAHLHLR